MRWSYLYNESSSAGKSTILYWGATNRANYNPPLHINDDQLSTLPYCRKHKWGDQTYRGCFVDLNVYAKLNGSSVIATQ